MTSNFEEQGAEPTFYDWFVLVISGWKVLLLGTFVGAIVGFLNMRWAVDLYYVDSTVLIETEQNPSLGAYGDLEDMLMASSNSKTEEEIFRSRMVLIPVVDSLSLRFIANPTSVMDRFLGQMGRIEFNDLRLPRVAEGLEPWKIVGRTDSLATLVTPQGDSLNLLQLGVPFETVFKGDTLRVEIALLEARAGEEFEVAVRSTARAVQKLLGALSVKEKGKSTGLLQLGFIDEHPDRAMEILNEVTRSYMRQNIDAKSAEASKTLGFLKAQLPAVKAKLDSADSALNAFRRSRGTVDLTTEAKLALDQQVTLSQQLLEAQQKKLEYSRLYEENHPMVISLSKQIARYQSTIGKASTKSKSLPGTQQEVLKLTRDVTVATAFYESMLDKIQQLEVVRAGEVGNARILDSAQYPSGPSFPNRRNGIILATLVGFVLGFGLLLLKKVFDKGVADPAKIERQSRASIFAQIPQSRLEWRQNSRLRQRALLSDLDPDDLAVEGIRNLRTALEFSLVGQGGKVLGISGLTPRVGKSFVSANLSCLFAMTGKKILLVDADLRKGRLQAFFEAPRAPGLSDLLSGRVTLEESIRRVGKSAVFHFLPTGTFPSNPAEMLGSVHFGDLIGRLRAEYDLIIVDTSPALLVTDPSLVMRHVDHVTLVLEQGGHSMADILEAIRLVKVKPELGVSLVLNKCRDQMGFGKNSRYGRYAPTRGAEVG
jgi:tyrosine-protein kinase Etk/Wzc